MLGCRFSFEVYAKKVREKAIFYWMLMDMCLSKFDIHEGIVPPNCFKSNTNSWIPDFFEKSLDARCPVWNSPSPTQLLGNLCGSFNSYIQVWFSHYNQFYVQNGATSINIVKLCNLNKHVAVQKSLYFINYIQPTYLPVINNETFNLFLYSFVFFKTKSTPNPPIPCFKTKYNGLVRTIAKIEANTFINW